MTVILVLVVLVAIGVAVGCKVSPEFRRTVMIWNRKAQQKLTTPEEREAQLVAEQERIVADGSTKASNLRGSLSHARNKLAAAETAVTQAKSDYKLAVQMAKDASRDPQTDPIVNQQLENVAAALKAVELQTFVVEGLEQAVQSTRDAVEAARAKLTQLQATLTTDAAKAKATQAISSAATVVDSFKGLNGAGARIQQEHDAVDERFEQAKARLEDAQGPQAQRDFDAAKQAHDLDSLRAALDAE